MRDDKERLLDILEAIERIERYSAQGRENFEQNELIQTWILHHLRILCEAARAISADLKQQHPEVAWPRSPGCGTFWFIIISGLTWPLCGPWSSMNCPCLKDK